MTGEVCRDPVTRDQWYAIAALPECPGADGRATRLLGAPIVYGIDGDRPFARATGAPSKRQVTSSRSTRCSKPVGHRSVVRRRA